jgi:hypothetical protein
VPLTPTGGLLGKMLFDKQRRQGKRGGGRGGGGGGRSRGRDTFQSGVLVYICCSGVAAVHRRYLAFHFSLLCPVIVLVWSEIKTRHGPVRLL